MTLLSVDQVTKKILGQVVLDSLSFNIEVGKIVGLFGINGAGKTTLLKAICGLVKPDQGTVKLQGNILDNTEGLISYVGQKIGFMNWMKPKDISLIMSTYYNNFSEQKFNHLLKKFEVPNKPITALSRGQIKRIRLCAHLSVEAKLYLFDESLSGVDPISREIILKHLISEWQEESSIIISTHELNDVSQILDSCLFLKNGRLLEQITIDEISDKKMSLREYFLEVDNKDRGIGEER